MTVPAGTRPLKATNSSMKNIFTTGVFAQDARTNAFPYASQTTLYQQHTGIARFTFGGPCAALRTVGLAFSVDTLR
jgi:hypothetical protein